MNKTFQILKRRYFVSYHSWNIASYTYLFNYGLTNYSLHFTNAKVSFIQESEISVNVGLHARSKEPTSEGQLPQE